MSVRGGKRGKEIDSFPLSHEFIAFNSYKEDKVGSNLSIIDQDLKGNETQQTDASHWLLILAGGRAAVGRHRGTQGDCLFRNHWATSSPPRNTGTLLLGSCERPHGSADPPQLLPPPPSLAAR